MIKLRCADTSLARWLTEAMGTWIDPETSLRGIAQRQLSAMAGVSQTQIQAILKQGHAPGVSILKNLADFFAVALCVLDTSLFHFLPTGEGGIDEDVVL